MTIDEVDAEETRTIGGDSEEETEEDEGTEEVSEDEDEEHDDDEDVLITQIKGIDLKIIVDYLNTILGIIDIIF